MFTANARRDLTGMLQYPIVSGDIKIISNDGKEFSAQRRILAARSPVFEAMLRTNMKEKNDGIIELPDISSKALHVLLTFLYTGEILPEWKEDGVILEFTNAAAKYQLSELLQFLNVMLGKVCQLHNVASLILLARQPSLTTAEEELLKFVKEKGTSSTVNFYQVLNGLSGF